MQQENLGAETAREFFGIAEREVGILGKVRSRNDLSEVCHAATIALRHPVRQAELRRTAKDSTSRCVTH
jgi:hypothetical protein